MEQGGTVAVEGSRVRWGYVRMNSLAKTWSSEVIPVRLGIYSSLRVTVVGKFIVASKPSPKSSISQQVLCIVPKKPNGMKADL